MLKMLLDLRKRNNLELITYKFNNLANFLIKSTSIWPKKLLEKNFIGFFYPNGTKKKSSIIVQLQINLMIVTVTNKNAFQ